MFEYNYNGYEFKCDIGTMTPLQYIEMIELLHTYKPKDICELGSGESTKIFEKYSEKNECNLFSIEHDEKYNIHRSNIMFPLKEDTSLSLNGKNYYKCDIYDGFEEWITGQNKFDFVLIDGPNDILPFNYKNLKYSRIQMFDFVLLDKLTNNAVVIYHDSERNVAQETLFEFEKVLTEKNFSFIKETVIEKDRKIIDYNVSILGVCPEMTVYKLTRTTI